MCNHTNNTEYTLKNKHCHTILIFNSNLIFHFQSLNEFSDAVFFPRRIQNKIKCIKLTLICHICREELND